MHLIHPSINQYFKKIFARFATQLQFYCTLHIYFEHVNFHPYPKSISYREAL